MYKYRPLFVHVMGFYVMHVHTDVCVTQMVDLTTFRARRIRGAKVHINSSVILKNACIYREKFIFINIYHHDRKCTIYPSFCT